MLSEAGRDSGTEPLQRPSVVEAKTCTCSTQGSSKDLANSFHFFFLFLWITIFVLRLLVL